MELPTVGEYAEVATLTGISIAEKEYIRKGVGQNVRSDGRTRNQFRPIEVAIGVTPHALASSRIRNSESDVVCSISADLIAPPLDNPGQGMIYVNVQMSSPIMADSQLQVFNDDSTGLSRRLGHALVTGPLNQAFVPRESLVVLPKRFVWRICVDIMVMTIGGGLEDLVSYAMMVALRNTKLPNVKLILEHGENGGEADETAGDGDVGGIGDIIDSDEILPLTAISENKFFDLAPLKLHKLIDFQLEDSGEMTSTPGKPFPNADKIPIIVSVGQIDGQHVCDMTHEEKMSVDTVVSALIDQNGDLKGLSKRGGSGVSLSLISSVTPLMKTTGREVFNAVIKGTQRAGELADTTKRFSWHENLRNL